jgi:hypothetical protein
MSRFSQITLFGFLCVALSFSTGAFAQNEPKAFEARNALYLELGGSSGRYAVNFSRIIHQKGNLKLNASAGFAFWHYSVDLGPAYQRTRWLPTIPLEFSAFWGRSNHHLELGIGFISGLKTTPQIDPTSFEITEKMVYDVILPIRIGYRYQKPGGGFFYRVGYTPFFSPPVGGRENWNFEPRFAGISIGKSF